MLIGSKLRISPSDKKLDASQMPALKIMIHDSWKMACPASALMNHMAQLDVWQIPLQCELTIYLLQAQDRHKAETLIPTKGLV